MGRAGSSQHGSASLLGSNSSYLLICSLHTSLDFINLQRLKKAVVLTLPSLTVQAEFNPLSICRFGSPCLFGSGISWLCTWLDLLLLLEYGGQTWGPFISEVPVVYHRPGAQTIEFDD
jgi:hypothetical protein